MRWRPPAQSATVRTVAHVWLQPKEVDIMRKFLGVGAAAVLALMAHVAAADQMKGQISNINLTSNTFMVGDMLFAASPQNTVGAKLADLKEGDKVTVTYVQNRETRGENAINALTLKKEE
jgi:hypothetical protein